MGVTLTLIEDETDTGTPLYTAVERLIREVAYLNRCWEGNLPEQIVIDSCKKLAAALGLDSNAGDKSAWAKRSYQVPANGAFYSEKGAGDTKYVFQAGQTLGRIPSHYIDTGGQWAKSGTRQVAVPSKVGSTKTLVERPTWTLAKSDDPASEKVTVKMHVTHRTDKMITCASCRREVALSNTSLSHNVIPQATWKAIMDAVFARFIQVVNSGSLVAKYTQVRHYSSESGVESGKKTVKTDQVKFVDQASRNRARQDAKETKKQELIRVFKQQKGDSVPLDEIYKMLDAKKAEIDKAGTEAEKRLMEVGKNPNQEFFDRLLADRMIEKSYYAAQDQDGRQCRDCEEAQGATTLMQRDALLRSGALASIEKLKIDDVQTVGTIRDANLFVGCQFVSMTNARFDVNGTAVPVVTPEKIAAVHRQTTLRQISRYLAGVEKTIEELWDAQAKAASTAAQGQRIVRLSPLLALIIDHLDEFVWTFRSVALEMCSASFTGSLNVKTLLNPPGGLSEVDQTKWKKKVQAVKIDQGQIGAV